MLHWLVHLISRIFLLCTQDISRARRRAHVTHCTCCVLVPGRMELNDGEGPRQPHRRCRRGGRNRRRRTVTPSRLLAPRCWLLQDRARAQTLELVDLTAPCEPPRRGGRLLENTAHMLGRVTDVALAPASSSWPSALGLMAVSQRLRAPPPAHPSHGASFRLVSHQPAVPVDRRSPAAAAVGLPALPVIATMWLAGAQRLLLLFVCFCLYTCDDYSFHWPDCGFGT